jgi:uncharacterized membrane protein
MKFYQIKQNFSKFSIILRFLIILALIAGVILRFSNLDGKLYSNDEAFSTTYIFGHNLANAGVIDSRIITAGELQDFQKVNFHESFSQSVNRLLETPYVFPPLYSIGMHIWARFWTPYLENPAIITRSFSVLISLFSLPCMYWLCWELSGSAIMAWIGTALIAISPFHLQYSQIVRTYSFLTVATLLSSASLLQAKRLQTRISWIIYAATVAIGLYANILFGFVIIAHGTYIILVEKFRLNKIVKSYLIASFAGIAVFLPWFIQFISKPSLLNYTVEQVSDRSSLIGLLVDSFKNLKKLFIDLNDPWIDFTQNLQLLQRLSFPFILILIVISVLYCIQKISRPACLFILCIIGMYGGLMLMKDAIMGGTVSVRLRYMIPYVIGINLAVAYFLAILIGSKITWRKKLGEILVSILIIGGILSCSVIAKADSWWAFGAPDYPSIARQINRESYPVVIYEDWGDALTMSYLLKPEIHNHLTRKQAVYLTENSGKIYQEFSNIILFKPSKELRDYLKNETNFKLERLFHTDAKFLKTPDVWKIQNR